MNKKRIFNQLAYYGYQLEQIEADDLKMMYFIWCDYY